MSHGLSHHSLLLSPFIFSLPPPLFLLFSLSLSKLFVNFSPPTSFLLTHSLSFVHLHTLPLYLTYSSLSPTEKNQIDNLSLAKHAEELVIMDGGQTLDASREVIRLTGSLTSQRFFFSYNNLMILNMLSTKTNAATEGLGTFQVTYQPRE